MNLRNTGFCFLVVAGLAGMTACDEKPKGDDPVKVAGEHNEEKFDNEKEKTADFMVYATDLHLHEIQLGELAMGNGHTPAIKKLGKLMAEDHRKSLKELQKLAADKSVTIPETVSHESQKDCDRLAKNERKKFDSEYAEMLVEDHKDALKRFEKEAEEGEDKEVRKWAFDMLPSLRTHLDHALALEREVGGNKDTAVVVEHDDAGVKAGDEKKDRSKEGTAKDTKTEQPKNTQGGKKDW